jgi:hypothetical protein
MADKRYRLNVDFDNSILPFLYGGAGTWTFKVPSAPNFMGGRYVVFLPGAMVLSEVDKIPQISGFTRVEGAVPSAGEFRTIEVDNFEEYLLKDAIEFHSSAAGSTLTITNLWTMGSTVAPDIGDRYTDEKEGVDLFTGRETGTNSHVTTGILYCSEGYCVVNGVEVVIDAVKTLTPTVELTTGYWYLVYLDSTGNFHFEITSNNTADIFPEAQVNTLAPVRSTKLGRYQSGNPDRRLIGCARASSGTLFHDKVFNLPEPTFGTGCLGDVTLDGTGLGATATPLYGIRENVATTPVYRGEYHFDNLTINGTCYCGDSNGLSLDPVIIRVRGTLTIGASGQLNGDSRGANGGAGGTNGGNTGQPTGGAGGKSGRPTHIYANRIINLRSSDYAISSRPQDGSRGSAGTLLYGGGGGGGSLSEVKVITNSVLSSTLVNPLTISDGGEGYSYSSSSLLSTTWSSAGRGSTGKECGGNGYISGLGFGDFSGGLIGQGGARSGAAYGGGSVGCGGSGLNDGSTPAISHLTLSGEVLIIDSYSSRRGI